MFTSDSTVREYITDWIELHPVSDRTRQDYAEVSQRLIYPTLGSLSIGTVDYRTLQRWLNRAADRSFHQARQALSVIRQALALAVREGLRDDNPAIDLRLPSATRTLPTPLDSAQVLAVHHHIVKPQDKLLFLTLACGGMRFSEVAALTPDSVCDGFLLLSQSVQPRHGGGLMMGDLKTHQQRRVYLPDFLMVMLHEHAEDQRRRGVLWLFSSASGTPIDRANFSNRVLRPACEAAGVPVITPHALRDTCATLSLEAGLPAQVVAGHLGHADAATTLRHYAGVLPSQRKKLAASLGHLFENGIDGANQQDG